MDRIGGGGLLVSVPARPDENVVWKVWANRKPGRAARGGQLHLTTERLVFTPHRLDAALGGRAHSIELRQIASVTKARRTFSGDFHAGGLRERLCVALREGGSEFFVVHSPDEVAEKLRRAMVSKEEAGALAGARRRFFRFVRGKGFVGPRSPTERRTHAGL